MIAGIGGDVGSGKTMFMTWLLKLASVYTQVYANYKLNFPYTPIESIEDLYNMNLTDKKLIGLDEAWVTADSRTAGSKSNIKFTQFILQARKKRAHVLYTVQDMSQIDKRIRVNSEIFLFPEVFSTIKDSITKEEVPYYLKVGFYTRDYQPIRHSFFMIYPAHRWYDTLEVVNETESIEYGKLKAKYAGFGGKKAELKSILVIDEGLSKANAGILADYIMCGVEPGDYMNEEE